MQTIRALEASNRRAAIPGGFSVFVDETGRRLRRAKVVGFLVLAASVGYMVVLGASVAASPVTLLGLPPAVESIIAPGVQESVPGVLDGREAPATAGPGVGFSAGRTRPARRLAARAGCASGSGRTGADSPRAGRRSGCPGAGSPAACCAGTRTCGTG